MHQLNFWQNWPLALTLHALVAINNIAPQIYPCTGAVSSRPMSVARISASALRLWVLAWFMASLGVAIASPLVHPQSIEVICSSAGTMKLLVQTDDGPVEMGAMGMDCPLCAIAGAPPPAPCVAVPPPHPLAHALQPVESARIAAATAAPLPARGPPSRS